MAESSGALSGLYSQNAAAIYQSLAHYMQRSGRDQASAGVVFILGAGCSMQYGLPSFQGLLENIAREHLAASGVPESLRELRRSQEVFWSALDAEARREVLQGHLGGDWGGDCLGYVWLAELLRRGWVKAILDMNFDGLLEQACKAIGYQPTFARNVDPGAHGVITKIHGGLKPEQGKPIISLKETEFFGKGTVARNLNRLLLENHVVMLGYEGEDPDLRHALWNRTHPAACEEKQKEERPSAEENGVSGESAVGGAREAVGEGIPDRRIFVFQVEGINPQLFELIRRRNSDLLTLSGPEAGFENVMEALWRLAGDPATPSEQAAESDPRAGEGGRRRDRRKVERIAERTRARIRRGALGGPELDLYVTNAERIALSCCFGLAQEIRAGINVPQVSRTRLDEHAEEVYANCMTLARMSRLFLSPVEKHLLFCAAILHDLGYFLGYAQGEAHSVRGWWFLHTHGERTSLVLGEALREHPDLVRAVLPQSYDPASWEAFWDTLLALCHCHTWCPPRSSGDGEASWSLGESFEVSVCGAGIQVRPDVLLALLNLAELVTSEQPVPDFGPASFEGGRLSILEDPVMSLFLHRPVVRFQLTGSAVQYLPKSGLDATSSEALALGLDRVQESMERLAEYGPETCVGLRLLSMEGREWSIGQRAATGPWRVRAALEEHFVDLLSQLPEVAGAFDPLARQQDLVAAFAMPGRRPADDESHASERLDPATSRRTVERLQRWGRRVRRHFDLTEEPRVPLERIEHHARAEHRQPTLRDPLLSRYLRIHSRGARSWVESAYLDYYELLFYPAWRYFASAWLRDIYHVSMARFCLDLGSTDLRVEVGRGVRDLLGRRVHWRSDEVALGHEGCTLCTGRILLVCCRLAGLGPIESFGGETSACLRSVPQVVRGLLRYLTERKADDPAWWGLEERGFQSVEYLAMGVRALASVLALDHASEATWLQIWGIERREVERCFQQQWQQLTEQTSEELVRKAVEDSVVLCLAEVARTISIAWEFQERGRLGIEIEAIERATRALYDASQRFAYGSAGFVDVYHLPIQALVSKLAIRGSTAIGAEEVETVRGRLLKGCYDCANSGVWIGLGEDTGSWGYNTDNTQDLVMCLEEAWRHLLDHPEIFEPLFVERGPELRSRSKFFRSQPNHWRQLWRRRAAKAVIDG